MLSELDLYVEELRRRREREHCGTPARAQAESLDRIVPQKALWQQVLCSTEKRVRRQ